MKVANSVALSDFRWMLNFVHSRRTGGMSPPEMNWHFYELVAEEVSIIVLIIKDY